MASLGVRVLMSEITMTLLSLDGFKEPCKEGGGHLHSLGSDPQAAPEGGKAEALAEALICLLRQGLIYRYPLAGCQARGKWEQRC